MKDKKAAIEHLKTHQSYPATRNELITECNELSDFEKADKQWFMSHLPEGTYNSAEAVMKALNW